MKYFKISFNFVPLLVICLQWCYIHVALDSVLTEGVIVYLHFVAHFQVNYSSCFLFLEAKLTAIEHSERRFSTNSDIPCLLRVRVLMLRL